MEAVAGEGSERVFSRPFEGVPAADGACGEGDQTDMASEILFENTVEAFCCMLGTGDGATEHPTQVSRRCGFERG